MFRHSLVVIVVAWFLGLPGVCAAQDKDQSKRLAAIGVLNEKYVTAFNQQDAPQLSNCFSKEAEFTLLTGQTIAGRAKVSAAHADFFKNYPDAKIAGEQTSIRAITPHIFLASGTWKVTGGPKEYPSSGVWFTVVSFYTDKLQYEAMRLMSPAKK